MKAAVRGLKVVRELDVLKNLKGQDAEPIEEVGKSFCEGRLELDRQQRGLASKRTRKGLRLVFVPGLAVGQYQDFVHVSDVRHSATDILSTC